MKKYLVHDSSFTVNAEHYIWASTWHLAFLVPTPFLFNQPISYTGVSVTFPDKFSRQVLIVD